MQWEEMLLARRQGEASLVLEIEMHKDTAHAKPILEIEIGDAGISARPLSSLPTNDEFLLVGAELDDQTCRAIHAIQVDCHRHTE